MKTIVTPLLFCAGLLVITTGCSQKVGSQLQIVVNSSSVGRSLNVASRDVNSPIEGSDSFIMSNVTGLNAIGTVADPNNPGHKIQVSFSPIDPLKPDSSLGPIDWLSLDPPPPTFTLEALPGDYTSLIICLSGIDPATGIGGSTLTFSSGTTTLSIPYPYDSTWGGRILPDGGDPSTITTLPGGYAIWGDITNTDGFPINISIPRTLNISVVEESLTTIYLDWDFSQLKIVDDGAGSGHLTKADGSSLTAANFWDCLSISSITVPIVLP